MSEPQSNSRLIFHLPPDAGPLDTAALLGTLQRYPQRFTTLRDLCAAASQEYGAGERYQDASTIAALTDLITIQPEGPALTALGQQVAADPDLQTDLIHFLLYTGWDEAAPAHATPLWSYRAICNLLWQQGEADVSSAWLVRETMLVREDQFAAISAYRQHPTSFSGKSVRGVLVWLEQLHPPAIVGNNFRRRSRCSLPLLLLALGWVFRDIIGETDDPDRLSSVELLLREDRRERLAQLCLLDPSNLDRLVDLLLDTYPQYLSEGTQAGTYGRFVRLRRVPRLDDPTLWDTIA